MRAVTEALPAYPLIATSYHHVWFSQNARAYTTLALLRLVTSGLLLRVLRDGRTRDSQRIRNVRAVRWAT